MLKMDEIEMKEGDGMNGSGFGNTCCLASQYWLRNWTEKAFSVIAEISVTTTTFCFLIFKQ